MSVKQTMAPDKEQVLAMLNHADHARFVYNIGLEQQAMWRRDKHDRGERSAARVNATTQMRELADLRSELDWLRAGSSSVQQAALRDLDRAFANFFAGSGKYPTFKRRGHRNGGFYIRDLRVRRLNHKWGEVLVPKVGYVRFRITRLWAEIQAATSARVSLHDGAWSVSFTTPAKPKIVAGSGELVGIDRGVANTVATSDGQMLSIPHLTDGEKRRWLALERQLARQTRAAKRDKRRFVESHNRERTLDKLAVLRRRLDHRRTDWIEQTTTQMARRYDGIVIEDLHIKNMVKKTDPKPDPDRGGVFRPNGAAAKSGLNRAIHASCWGKFAARLDHKTVVVGVPASYSSQECRACGHVATENRESQAEFCCVACGHEAHADVNAAQVILARGATKLALALAPNPGTPGARPHKPRARSGRGNPTDEDSAA